MTRNEWLKRIRQRKDWLEGLDLARDNIPGTPHDEFIRKTLAALARWESDCPELIADNKQWLEKVAERTARAIWNGNSDFFRELADALDEWRNHQPRRADKLREELIRIEGLPGRILNMSAIRAQLRRGVRKLRVRRAPRVFDMRQVHNELRRRGIRITEAVITATWRIARELGWKMVDKPRGRPRKSNTKPMKSPR